MCYFDTSLIFLFNSMTLEGYQMARMSENQRLVCIMQITKSKGKTCVIHKKTKILFYRFAAFKVVLKFSSVFHQLSNEY